MTTKMLVTVCFVASFISIALSINKTHTSMGDAGEECGDIKCLDTEGECVTDTLGNQTCACTSYRRHTMGQGDLACYKKNKIYATIRSEPIVRTFDGVKYQLNLPCRVLATKFVSRLKLSWGQPEHQGTCECEVHTWQKKHKGKFYPHGFDAACLLRRVDTEPHNITGFSLRKYGTAKNGVYSFYERGVTSFLPNGPWTEEKISVRENGIITECGYNDINNIAFIDQRNCGLRVDLRPFDSEKGRYQLQPNGIAIGLNCANQPDLKDNHRTIMSGPTEHDGIPFEKSLEEFPHLTAEEVFLFRALTSDVEQNHPDYSEECNALSDSALMCNDKPTEQRQAMDQCKWMLHSQPFIKCVDTSDNAHTLLTLVRRCFDQACTTGPSSTCNNFVDHLQAIPAKCRTPKMFKKVEKLNTWLNTNDFCVR